MSKVKLVEKKKRKEEFFKVVNQELPNLILAFDELQEQREIERQISSVAYHQLRELSGKLAKYEYKQVTVDQRK